MTRCLTPAVILLLALWTAPLSAQVTSKPRPEGVIVVPYEPSPQNVVDGMLKIGDVGPNDFIIDLGSGDGRIVISAAKKYGTRGFGVDLNPDLIMRSIANAQAAGVADKVTFHQQDIFKTDLSAASVITMFLYPQVNLQLRPKLLDLKPGTRIVSHFHSMGEWLPDRRERLMTTEHYGDTWIFMWYVPAKVAGSWQWMDQRSGVLQQHTLTLRQRFQDVEGRLMTDSLRPIEIRDAKLKGALLTFWVPIREGGRTTRWNFRGEVSNDVIAGVESTMVSSGAREQSWRANRAAP